MDTELDEARAALLRKLSAENDLFHELLAGWVGDMRIGPKVRSDMRELLNPSEDGPFHYCAAHGLQRRAHPYYHDKGVHCAKCAMEADAGTTAAATTQYAL
jgi:hypothetical protein